MNLKKLNRYIYPLAGFILFVLFSCQLPDSGRMAVIDFNFTQPDILREADTAAVSDRIIPMETQTVMVIMYPSFSGDPLIDSDDPESYDVPTFEDIDGILTKPETRTLYMNFGAGFSGGSFENIEPGNYSFAVFTFNLNISSLGLNDMGNVMTWRIKKDVEIVPGMNLVDLPLKLNYTKYSGPIDVNGSFPLPPSVTTELLSETLFLSFKGFNAGECTVNFVTDLGPNVASLALYNEEGYLIKGTTTSADSGASLTFNATSPSFVLIVSSLIFAPNLRMEFVEYTESPQSLNLNIDGQIFIIDPPPPID
jgi:hypothetical protein